MLARNQSNFPASFFADALGKVQCTRMGIETYAQRCHQKWASDLHFHWKLSFFFLNIFHFHLNLLDPRVIVVDRCLKVHGPSDRRGKLLAWPSHAVTILTSFVPQESHSHWPHWCFWVPSATPKKNKVGRLLKDDGKSAAPMVFVRMTSVCMA